MFNIFSENTVDVLNANVDFIFFPSLFLFSDVAIGAPYEAGTGVVYIYNGAKTGLYQKYSQRIVGSDIDTGLRAFGYAISRPWDIDGNYYAGEVNHVLLYMLAYCHPRMFSSVCSLFSSLNLNQILFFIVKANFFSLSVYSISMFCSH